MIKKDNKTANIKKLLTPKQVAEIFGVAVSTVHKWTYKGLLPCVVLKHGKRKSVIRFRQEVLEAWIKKREIAPGRFTSYNSEDDATGTERG